MTWARAVDLPAYLYHLSNPVTREIKYVGITHAPPKRHAAHVGGKSEWILDLAKTGQKPVMTIFDFHEKRHWALSCEVFVISNAIKEGFTLINKGTGDYWHPSETQLKSYKKFIKSIKNYERIETINNLKVMPPLLLYDIEREMMFKTTLKQSEIDCFNSKANEMNITVDELMKLVIKNIDKLQKFCNCKFEI